MTYPVEYGSSVGSIIAQSIGGPTTTPPYLVLRNPARWLPENVDLTDSLKVADFSVHGGNKDHFVFTLSGPAADIFELTGPEIVNGVATDGGLSIKAGTTFDIETKDFYRVNVFFDDTSYGTGTEPGGSILLQILPETKAPSINLTNKVGELSEDAETGTQRKVADIDIEESNRASSIFTLSGPDADHFEIVGHELYLKAGARLDYETNPVLKAKVTISDSLVPSLPPDAETLRIRILDGPDIIRGTKRGDSMKGTALDEEMLGLGGSDWMSGKGGADVIDGGRGADTLKGMAGSDTLFGGAGDDILKGGAGNDQLNGGKGMDLLTGGRGADTFRYVRKGGHDTITDYRDGIDTIVFAGFGPKVKFLNRAVQDGDDVIFDFGKGHSLTVENAMIASLSDDILG